MLVKGSRILFIEEGRGRAANTPDVASLILRVIAGGLLSAAIAFVARRRDVLTNSGAWAAVAVGAALVFAGWPWLALVGVFFVTSSALTRLERRRTGGLPSRDRGGRRWQQVAANGGLAAAAAVISAITSWPQGYWVAAGAIAAATADTWATELGRWSGGPPRLITTRKPVAPGVSGGVTLSGTLGSVAGAFLIAAAALVLYGNHSSGGTIRSAWAAWIAGAGITGSLLDSLLGATIENRWPWLDNDAVNVAATAWGAALMLYPISRYM
jgi:uncharacterized protein (TIGR00297 family)